MRTRIVWLTCLFLISAQLPLAHAVSFKELQLNQRQTEQRKLQLQVEKDALDRKVEQKEQQLNEKLETLNELEKERQMIELNIQETEQKLVEQLDVLDKIQEELAEVQALYDERKKIADQRLIALQIHDRQLNYVDILLGASNILDFFKRIEGVNLFLQVDRDLMTAMNEEKEEIEEQQYIEQQALQAIETSKELLEVQRDFAKLHEERQREIVAQLKESFHTLTTEQQKVTQQYEADIERLKVIDEEMNELWKRQRPPTVIYPERTSGGALTPQISGKRPEHVSLICSDTIDDAFFKKLEASGKLAGQGPLILRIAEKHRIDPVIFAAITIHETGHGTSKAIREYNNPGGMMNPKTNWSTLIRYNSLEQGLNATARTISRLMNKGGLKTIEQLGAVYAPIGAANDPSHLNLHWAPSVKKFINEMGGYRCTH